VYIAGAVAVAVAVDETAAPPVLDAALISTVCVVGGSVAVVVVIDVQFEAPVPLGQADGCVALPIGQRALLVVLWGVCVSYGAEWRVERRRTLLIARWRGRLERGGRGW